MSEPHKLPKPVNASVDHVSWMTGRIQGKKLYCESNIISKISFEVRKKIHPWVYIYIYHRLFQFNTILSMIMVCNCVFPVNLCGSHLAMFFLRHNRAPSWSAKKAPKDSHSPREMIHGSFRCFRNQSVNLYGPFWFLMVACSSAEFSGCLGKQPFLYTLICVFSDFTVCCLVRKCQDVFERRVCPGRLCRFEASGLGVRIWFSFGRDASSQQKAQEHKRGSSKALRIR